MLARADDWGGPDSFPHMACGWAVATDTPFAYTKQVASDYGGTRNGMAMHWPNGFSAKGDIRSQWHHVNDIAPTVLEAAKLPVPKTVNGVKQRVVLLFFRRNTKPVVQVVAALDDLVELLSL